MCYLPSLGVTFVWCRVRPFPTFPSGTPPEHRLVLTSREEEWDGKEVVTQVQRVPGGETGSEAWRGIEGLRGSLVASYNV